MLPPDWLPFSLILQPQSCPTSSRLVLLTPTPFQPVEEFARLNAKIQQKRAYQLTLLRGLGVCISVPLSDRVTQHQAPDILGTMNPCTIRFDRFTE
jgi:hypothetical protein